MIFFKDPLLNITKAAEIGIWQRASKYSILMSIGEKTLTALALMYQKLFLSDMTTKKHKL